jgi:hypothetical protein
MRKVALLAIIFMLFPVMSFASTDPAFLIVPNSRLGKFYLHWNIDKFISELGKYSSKSESRRGGIKVDYYFWKKQGIAVIVRPDTKEVIEIDLLREDDNDPDMQNWRLQFKTSKNIGLGSTTDEIEKVYGYPNEILPWRRGEYWAYFIGLVFGIERSTKDVGMIGVWSLDKWPSRRR